jgi:prepilin signal peptidase PulO-like enzyme (type II secretory pathway)
MTAAFPVSCAGEILLLGTIARERARAYELELPALHPFSIVPAIAAVAVSAALADCGARTYGDTLALACAAVCASTDLLTGYVFDRVLAFASFGLLALSLSAHATVAAALGAAAGGGALYAVYFATRGRGIGLGDVKLAATIGFGLGAAGALEALRAATFSGGAAALALVAFGRVRANAALRFAPFLALGTAYGALRWG